MDLEQVFESAFSEFLIKERELILSGVSERCLCGRLAMFIEKFAHQTELNQYYADVEYNRNKGSVKTIIDGDYQELSVCCDLLLHSRNKVPDRDNLIAIEMKKAGRNYKETLNDCKRLEILTGQYSEHGFTEKHVCGYELGYFVELDARNKSCSIRTFRNGHEVAGITRQL